MDNSITGDGVDRCANCLAQDCTLRKCAQCQVFKYCSVPCQRRHWKRVHRQMCAGRSSSSNEAVVGASNSAVIIQAATEARSAERLEDDNKLHATNTMGDLYKQMGQMSIAEGHYRLQDANDEILKFRKEMKVKEIEEKKVASLILSQTKHEQQRLSNQQHQQRNQQKPTFSNEKKIEEKRKVESARSRIVSTHLGNADNAIDSSLTSQCKSVPIHCSSISAGAGYTSSSITWRCMMEDLVNLSCYSVIITPAVTEDSSGESDTMEILAQLSHAKRQELKLIFCHRQECKQNEEVVHWTELSLVDDTQKEEMVSLRVLGRVAIPLAENTHDNNGISETVDYFVADPSCITVERDCILLRLPYDPTTVIEREMSSGEDRQFTTSSDLERVNQMACGSCGHSLLSPNSSNNDNDDIKPQSIQRVLPLPTGYWDEIAEYLICFEGVSRIS
jgi:hypothetical protein